MKRYIVSKTDNRQYYVVTYGWDEGDAESGPIVKSGEIIVKARSKQDAEAKVSRKMPLDGCYARLADQSDIDDFIQYMKESQEEYQYLIDAGLVDPELDAQMEAEMDVDRFKKMPLGELQEYYRRFVEGYGEFDSFRDWYRSVKSKGGRPV